MFTNLFSALYTYRSIIEVELSWSWTTLFFVAYKDSTSFIANSNLFLLLNPTLQYVVHRTETISTLVTQIEL